MLDGIEKSDISTQEEMLQILKELRDKSESKEAFIEKAKEVIKLKPVEVGPFEIDLTALADNLSALVDKWFRKIQARKRIKDESPMEGNYAR